MEDGFPNCRGPLWEGVFFHFRKCPFEYDFVEHKSPIINIAFQFIFLLRQTIFSSDLTRISEQKTKVVPWWCVVGLGLTSWLYWHLRWKLKCSNLDRSCPTSHKQYRTWNQDVSQCNNIFIAASSLSGCFGPCGLVVRSSEILIQECYLVTSSRTWRRSHKEIGSKRTLSKNNLFLLRRLRLNQVPL